MMDRPLDTAPRWRLSTVLLLIALAPLSTACMNYTANLQDPSTLAKGESRVGVGGTGLLPWAFTMWGHFGVAEDLELQVRWGLPGSLELGLKWGLLGDAWQNGALVAVRGSVGGHFVFTREALGSDSGRAGGSAFVPIDASLQLGYRFGHDLVLYVAPRYSLRATATTDIERHGWAVHLGASAGPRKERVFLELGMSDNPFRWAGHTELFQRYYFSLSIGGEWD